MPNSSIQLSLIPPQNPLPGRFSPEFWNSIPPKPGVYLFSDEQGTVIYVGKSKNLRSRLFSYRSISRENRGGKRSSLIRRIRQIRFEVCDSEQHAFLYENELIRSLRPVYNHANKNPQTYYFIHTHLEPKERQKIRIELRMSMDSGLPGHWFGAFKGHRPVRAATGALNRLLYRQNKPVGSVTSYPGLLTRRLTPRVFVHAFDHPVSSIYAMLVQFLGGENEELLELVTDSRTEDAHPFFGYYHQRDAELLQTFFENKCRLTRRFIRKNGLHEGNIPQEDVDDFFVMSR